MARPLLPTLFPRPGASAGSLPALPRHPCVSLAPWPPLCPPGSWPWPPQPRGARPPYTPFLPAHRPPVLGPHSHFQDRGRADSENWGGSSSAAERDLRGSSEALGAPHPTCSLQPCLLPLAGVWGAVGAACFSFGKGTQDAHGGTPAGRVGGSCASLPHGPHSAGHARDRGRGGRSVVARGSGESRVGTRDWPLRREGTSAGSDPRDASKRCFKWFARTGRWGPGASLGPFAPSFPE